MPGQILTNVTCVQCHAERAWKYRRRRQAESALPMEIRAAPAETNLAQDMHRWATDASNRPEIGHVLLVR